MKYYFVFIVLFFCTVTYSQNCMTTENFYPNVIPVSSDIAIPTMGWEYNTSLSIEFNTGSLYNGWYFKDANYINQNAATNFSNDGYYWNLSGELLTLKLYDISGSNYDYTAAMLCHNNINQHYGYYEVKVKLPRDNDLCTSFWGFEGLWPSPDYREIDVFEFFTHTLQSNEYHQYTGPTSGYGGVMFVDPDIIDETEWITFGYEWFPTTYTLYVNNHFVGSFDSNTDCVKEELPNMSYWRLWIVNWVGHAATGTFPKELKVDYIRFYSMGISNIDNDFYDDLSDYDYGVWRTVHLGDTYSSDAAFSDNGKHAIRSTDGFTLGSGFEVSLGTEFETINYNE